MQFDSESMIMVIGVGGAGGNAVNHMQTMNITGVNFVVCNTDKQALNNCNVVNKIQIGPGIGAGNDPAVGRKYAIESEEQLRSLLETSGVRMLFIAAGMGGGTGTGASPVIAKLAHELGILTVAVVTMPFRMEGPGRYNSAVDGISELNKWVDSLLVIDNERLRKLYGKLPLKEAFGKADDVLGMATKGIAELITVSFALVRVDFADVERVMRGSGRAHMSVMKGSGENRSLDAAEGALSSSLLDDNHISGAKEILLSFSVSNIDLLTQDDVTMAMEYIQKHASYTDEDGNIHAADIIWGASEKPSLADDELELVVVATRFADGKNLNINVEYVNPEDDNPFDDVVEKKEPAKPQLPKNPPIVKPREAVTITPQQDRYRQITMQKRNPAYVRLNVPFEADNESRPRTIFQNREVKVAPEQEVSTNNNGGSLF
ncbi:MAG: cell division protein FtsZ [Alistipes sp.]|nr:cell division protein FtsZ [Alistipes sp.]MBR3826853.1 cell division protein FtsZ [Alistipes sp.]